MLRKRGGWAVALKPAEARPTARVPVGALFGAVRDGPVTGSDVGTGVVATTGWGRAAKPALSRLEQRLVIG